MEVLCITNTKEIKSGEPIVLYVAEKVAMKRSAGEKSVEVVAGKRQKQ